MTEQLELIQLGAFHVSPASADGYLSAVVFSQLNDAPAWRFTVMQDQGGWYVAVRHWLPGIAGWSTELQTHAVFRNRAVPHDLASMANFARWMLTGRES